MLTSLFLFHPTQEGVRDFLKWLEKGKESKGEHEQYQRLFLAWEQRLWSVLATAMGGACHVSHFVGVVGLRCLATCLGFGWGTCAHHVTLHAMWAHSGHRSIQPPGTQHTVEGKGAPGGNKGPYSYQATRTSTVAALRCMQQMVEVFPHTYVHTRACMYALACLVCLSGGKEWEETR